MLKLSIDEIKRFRISYNVLCMVKELIPNIRNIYATRHFDIYEFDALYIEADKVDGATLDTIGTYIIDMVSEEEPVCRLLSVACIPHVNDVYDLSEILTTCTQVNSLLCTNRTSTCVQEKLHFLCNFLTQYFPPIKHKDFEALWKLGVHVDFIIDLMEFDCKYSMEGKVKAYPYYKKLMKHRETILRVSDKLHLDIDV